MRRRRITAKVPIENHRMIDLTEHAEIWPQVATGKALANVEFVSADPNRDLDFQDIVAAITGDALSNILARCGWSVTREFYVNDSGLQADAFARSVYALLCAQKAGSEDLAHVEVSRFTSELIRHIQDQHSGDFDQQPEAVWLPKLRAITVDFSLASIRKQFHDFGITIDVFTHESQVMVPPRPADMLRQLLDRGLAYTVENAPGAEPTQPPRTLFATRRFGDTEDRPLTTAMGTWTYFMSDVLYHKNKVDRGFNGLVTIFRADYAAYVDRILACIRAFGQEKIDLAKIHVMDPVSEHLTPEKADRIRSRFTSRQLRWLLLSRPPGQPIDLDASPETVAAADAFLARLDHLCGRAPDDIADAVEVGHGRDLERLSALLAAWDGVVRQCLEDMELHALCEYLRALSLCLHELRSYQDEARDREIAAGRKILSEVSQALGIA